MTWSEQRPALGVIADDLTGANATGVLLTRTTGFPTASLTDLRWPEGGLDDYPCVVIATESRAIPADEARRRVTRAARLLLDHGYRPVAKRVDSTLRGNVGPEVEAVLETLGPGSVALVTGAFPASGRTTSGGIHYVHGVPLAETAVRNDPLCPVTESHVPTLLRRQTRLPVGQITLDTVRAGAGAVAEAIGEQARRGVRVLCPDAETDDDIRSLGEGMARSGIPCVAADPGPLTAAFAAATLAGGAAGSTGTAAATGTPAPAGPKRVLVVAGSVTPLTREQLDHLERETDARLITVDAGALGRDSDTAENEISRVVAALAAIDLGRPVIGVRTSEVLSSTDAAMAGRIAAGFAEIAARALERVHGLTGLYTSGGDITLAVCRRLQAGAIHLKAEVLPLAVRGYLIGGLRPGLSIVTKGGLVGDATAAVACVRHLLDQ
ncbi:MAG: four-carbon acid sugar kinase family protein [Symbiobacterium sp.]|uniref:four-carbon acid sugar kinase family protein n=1 Tax=Symbiobacterium sp. TaxID=1971213 RepID=UPI003464D7EC